MATLSEEHNEQGYALVTAILAIAALSSLLVTLQLTARQARSLVAADRQSLVEELAIDAAINRVISALGHPLDPLWNSVTSDGRPAVWSYDGYDVVLSVKDARSKADLNAVSEQDFLRDLARVPDMSDTERQNIYSAWRSRRGQGRPVTNVEDIIPLSLRFFGFTNSLEDVFTTVPSRPPDARFPSASVLTISGAFPEGRSSSRRRRTATVVLLAADQPPRILEWRSDTPAIPRTSQR